MALATPPEPLGNGLQNGLPVLRSVAVDSLGIQVIEKLWPVPLNPKRLYGIFHDRDGNFWSVDALAGLDDSFGRLLDC